MRTHHMSIPLLWNWSLACVAAAFLFIGDTPAGAASSSDSNAVPQTARRVTYEKAGAGYRFAVAEAKVPTPGPHQVLVHIRAVALNRGDIEVLTGVWPNLNFSGLVPASDGAGEIVAVGADVKDFKVGDRVVSTYFRDWTDGPVTAEALKYTLGASIDGVLADYVALEDTGVTKIPDGWSFAEAATLPTAGVTAWSAVIVEGKAGKGDTVLVQGTGGVSTFALQFAHAAGARTIVTSSSDEKLQRVRTLGADDTINYKTTPEWGARVMEMTKGQGADVVVEVGGKGTMEQSAKCLAQFGTIVIVGGLSGGYGGEIPAATLLMKTARAVGIFVGSRADFDAMKAFMVSHQVRPVIDHVYPFADLEAAAKQLEENRVLGKVVVEL